MALLYHVVEKEKKIKIKMHSISTNQMARKVCTDINTELHQHMQSVLLEKCSTSNVRRALRGLSVGRLANVAPHLFARYAAEHAFPLAVDYKKRDVTILICEVGARIAARARSCTDAGPALACGIWTRELRRCVCAIFEVSVETKECSDYIDTTCNTVEQTKASCRLRRT